MKLNEFLAKLADTRKDVRWYISPTGMIRGERRELERDRQDFMPLGSMARIVMQHSPLTAVYGYLNYANTYSDQRVAVQGLRMSKLLAQRVANASMYPHDLLTKPESAIREAIVESLGLTEWGRMD